MGDEISFACRARLLPLRYLHVNSPYGNRWHPLNKTWSFHAGVDLRGRADTVFAILDGRVLHVALQSQMGLHIRIKHHEVESIYGHLREIFVLAGDHVNAGDAIGITGTTGQVTGEHLHFAVRFRQRYIDPTNFLKTLLQKQDIIIIQIIK